MFLLCSWLIIEQLCCCLHGAILSGKARVKGRGSLWASTTAVVAQQLRGSDLHRRALSGDPGCRGTRDSHNNANKYYGKWLCTLLPLSRLLPSSGQWCSSFISLDIHYTCRVLILLIVWLRENMPVLYCSQLARCTSNASQWSTLMMRSCWIFLSFIIKKEIHDVVTFYQRSLEFEF